MTRKITRTRLEDARERFLLRVELFEEGPDDEVDIDEVIARGVTLADLQRSRTCSYSKLKSVTALSGGLIRVAREQLVVLEAQRFVGICFFHGRVHQGHRRIAALVMALDRKPNTDRVRIIAEMSFGNAPVPATALASLSTVPTLAEDAGRVVELGASPFEDVVVTVDDTRWALQDRPGHPVANFVVPLPGRLDLVISLWEVFAGAISNLWA